MPVYALFLLAFFVLPVAVLGLSLRSVAARYRHTIAWSLAFVYTLGAAWDLLAVRTGVWRYDVAPTLGVWIGGLPVEEFAGFYVFGTLWIVGVVLLALGRSDHV